VYWQARVTSYTSARPMHQLAAARELTGLRDGVSPMAQSTAAAAIDDGQWSKNSMSAAVHMFTFTLELHRSSTVLNVCDSEMLQCH
jgi:hypothetical protein